jgi:hypothetical protein
MPLKTLGDDDVKSGATAHVSKNPTLIAVVFEGKNRLATKNGGAARSQITQSERRYGNNYRCGRKSSRDEIVRSECLKHDKVSLAVRVQSREAGCEGFNVVRRDQEAGISTERSQSFKVYRSLSVLFIMMKKLSYEGPR